MTSSALAPSDMSAGSAVAATTGRPYPLGATFDGDGVNFAVFSAHATAIDVCLFAPLTGHEYARVRLPELTDEVWHGHIAGLKPGTVYGLRAHGPYDPEAGHRFNPNKLLIDPYAKVLTGRIRTADVMAGYQALTHDDLTFDTRDSAPVVPKALVADPHLLPPVTGRPNRAMADSILYEAHARGLTMRHPAVPEEVRGRYEALTHPAILEHLVRIGVTAVELLPIQAFVDEGFLVRKGLTNYWGYSSIAYFAPEPRYDQTSRGIGTVERVRAMVDRFHAAGIEVILDVVYNHTGEVDQLGPTLSFRGLDNASYYRLNPNRPRWYVNDTGTGNTLNVGHPRVTQLVLDSLRYWVTAIGIDGFRFDLAATLGREPTGFDPNGRFLGALRQDPVLSTVKLIAEPWDIGPGGYQVGNFPPGHSEWNDRFRDTVRRFWRGDEGVAPEFAARLLGSADLFDRRGRRPWASLNFVTAHDGFTLQDLVSYGHKHNEANLEDNRDGHSDNHSANYGVEGATGLPGVLAIRRRQVRNFLATLFLSQGVPMLTAGDELGNSQGGNNNAYCQDNPTGWVDWPALSRDPDLVAFTAHLATLRRTYPVLRQSRFLHAEERPSDGMLDVQWFNTRGHAAGADDWRQRTMRAFGVVLRGAALPHQDDEGPAVLLFVNAGAESMPVTLPRGKAGHGWQPVLATDAPAGLPSATATLPPGRTLEMQGRSILAFAEGVLDKRKRPTKTTAEHGA
ncbi:glycogen debranching protein GlgX [Mongoliimonas terrestris]|uniref:glycogen debranching protein GlgX n=1 Tax=Mongoliimonas terrestris TaxID=1709001 RepID=UPI001AECD956|nr:glycogen debranching protein GlgX [Mongoliimonas terrestris]